MRFHNQNLKRGREKGWHGRLWLYLGNATLRFEWHFPISLCHVGITIGGEESDIRMFIAILLGGIYVTTIGLLPKKWQPGQWKDSVLHPGKKFWNPEARETKISIHDGGVWMSIWENTMGRNRDDPWWMHNVIFPLDILLGKETSKVKTYECGYVDVCLPESVYQCKYVLTERTYKRPRWPWSRTYLRGEIIPNTPIPIPGKGESSWDLDDDAIHSSSMLAVNALELAAELEDSVMQTRNKYGGWHWQQALNEIKAYEVAAIDTTD